MLIRCVIGAKLRQEREMIVDRCIVGVPTVVPSSWETTWISRGRVRLVGWSETAEGRLMLCVSAPRPEEERNKHGGFLTMVANNDVWLDSFCVLRRPIFEAMWSPALLFFICFITRWCNYVLNEVIVNNQTRFKRQKPFNLTDLFLELVCSFFVFTEQRKLIPEDFCL